MTVMGGAVEPTGITQERLEGREVATMWDGDTALFAPEMFEGDTVAVAFDGYLAGNDDPPARHIASLYQQCGGRFSEGIDGCFRVAVHDRDAEEIHLATDPTGSRPLYYTVSETGVVFGSHATFLLDASPARPTLDMDTAATYLRSWSIALGDDRVLLDGVKKLPGAERVRYSDGVLDRERYWDVPRPADHPPSIVTAADRLERLLRQATENLLEIDPDPPTALISTGMGGQLVASLLDACTEGRFTTYGWGFDQDAVTAIGDTVARFGTDFNPLQVEPRLPTRDDVRQYEAPSVLQFYLSLADLSRECEVDRIFTEQSYPILFPPHLGNVRRLDTFAAFRPLARVMRWSGIDRLLSQAVARAGNAIDALASPYRSAAMTNDHTLRRERTDDLLAPDIAQRTPSPEERLDTRWNLSDRSYAEAFQYLQLHEREGGYWLPLQWQACAHRDILTQKPVLEHMFSLPPSMRRPVFDALARKRDLSAPIDPVPNRWGETVIRPALDRSWDRYRAAIDRFLDRNLLRPRARSVLLPGRLERCANNRLEYMASIYLLELWMEAFMDGDGVWRREP